MKDKLPFIDYQRAYCLSRCYVYECVFITCQDAMFMDAYLLPVKMQCLWMRMNGCNRGMQPAEKVCPEADS